MKTFVAVILAVFTVISANAQPQIHRGNFQHNPAFRPQGGGNHFVARSGNSFRPRFHYGNGGVVIFDTPSDGGDYDLPGDNTVYQGQVAPQDTERLPFATPTSDPNVVISPYEPHAAINVADIPHGAEVQDPISNLVFLNP
jgi:hypothetical protein